MIAHQISGFYSPILPKTSDFQSFIPFIIKYCLLNAP